MKGGPDLLHSGPSTFSNLDNADRGCLIGDSVYETVAIADGESDDQQDLPVIDHKPAIVGRPSRVDRSIIVGDGRQRRDRGDIMELPPDRSDGNVEIVAAPIAPGPLEVPSTGSPGQVE